MGKIFANDTSNKGIIPKIHNSYNSTTKNLIKNWATWIFHVNRHLFKEDITNFLFVIKACSETYVSVITWPSSASLLPSQRSCPDGWLISPPLSWSLTPGGHSFPPHQVQQPHLLRHSWMQTNTRRTCAQHLIAEQELQGFWKYLIVFSLNIFLTIYLSMWAKIFNIMQSKQRNKWDIQVLIRLCLPSKPLISTFCSSNLPDYSNYNWNTFQFIQIKHFFSNCHFT